MLFGHSLISWYVLQRSWSHQYWSHHAPTYWLQVTQLSTYTQRKTLVICMTGTARPRPGPVHSQGLIDDDDFRPKLEFASFKPQVYSILSNAEWAAIDVTGDRNLWWKISLLWYTKYIDVCITCIKKLDPQVFQRKIISPHIWQDKILRVIIMDHNKNGLGDLHPWHIVPTVEVILLFWGFSDLYVNNHMHLSLVNQTFCVLLILMCCCQWSTMVRDVSRVFLWLFLPSSTAFWSNYAVWTLPHLLVRSTTLLEPSILIPSRAYLLTTSYSAQYLYPTENLGYMHDRHRPSSTWPSTFTRTNRRWWFPAKTWVCKF